MVPRASPGGRMLSKLSWSTKASGFIVLTVLALTVVFRERNFSPSGHTLDERLLLGDDSGVKAVNGTSVSKVGLAKNNASNETVISAKLLTCPRCRLNSLPLVKKFVHEQAKLFSPQLRVEFILGEDPVLYFYENYEEVSRIELESYHWKDIIRKLVDFGIKPNEYTKEIEEAIGSEANS